MLLISVIVNLCLLISIYYVEKSTSTIEFYASDGIQAPLKLQALEQANFSSETLIETEEGEGAQVNEQLLDKL